MIEEQFRGMSEAYSAQGRGPDQNLTKIVALSQEPLPLIPQLTFASQLLVIRLSLRKTSLIERDCT